MGARGPSTAFGLRLTSLKDDKVWVLGCVVVGKSRCFASLRMTTLRTWDDWGGAIRERVGESIRKAGFGGASLFCYGNSRVMNFAEALLVLVRVWV